MAIPPTAGRARSRASLSRVQPLAYNIANSLTSGQFAPGTKLGR